MRRHMKVLRSISMQTTYDLISLVSTESQDDLCAGSSLNPIIYDIPLLQTLHVTWRAREIDDDPTTPLHGKI